MAFGGIPAEIELDYTPLPGPDPATTGDPVTAEECLTTGETALAAATSGDSASLTNDYMSPQQIKDALCPVFKKLKNGIKNVYRGLVTAITPEATPDDTWVAPMIGEFETAYYLILDQARLAKNAEEDMLTASDTSDGNSENVDGNSENGDGNSGNVDGNSGNTDGIVGGIVAGNSGDTAQQQPDLVRGSTR